MRIFRTLNINHCMVYNIDHTMLRTRRHRVGNVSGKLLFLKLLLHYPAPVGRTVVLLFSYTDRVCIYLDERYFLSVTVINCVYC